jgi:putative PIN family toxin of toxin-antitoxin system
VLTAWKKKRLVLVTSESLIAEFVEVANRRHIKGKYHLTDARIQEMVDLLRGQAVITPELQFVQVVKDDPDDDAVIACALEGHAKYIVSGDPHLKNLGEYKGIKIVTANKLVTILNL